MSPQVEAPAPANEFIVSALGDKVAILRVPLGLITRDQALGLAAWLVAIVGDTERFDEILAAVEGT